MWTLRSKVDVEALRLLGYQNASKTCTLSTKVRQKRVPLGRKSFPKRGCLVGYGRNPKMILSQCCIDFDTKTYRFGHISGPSYRGAHAGWPAGWLGGRLAGGFGEVSGAYRLVLFIQLEVAHKHFRLARPTESAQGGRGSNRAC